MLKINFSKYCNHSKNKSANNVCITCSFVENDSFTIRNFFPIEIND